MQKVQRLIHCSGYSLTQDPKLRGRVVNFRGEEAVKSPHQLFSDWERVCWGEPMYSALGRIPATMYWGRHLKVNEIVWSTGCTRIRDGAWEAEVMRDRAADHARLRKDFPRHFEGHILVGANAHASWVKSRSTIDTTSTTTSSSMDWLAAYVRKKYADSLVFVYLVSSANHAPRVLRDAMLSFNFGEIDRHAREKIRLCMIPADTSYGLRGVRLTKILDLGV